MCGLHAVNHILSALGLQNVTEKDIDGIAQEMADRESNILYSMDPSVVLANAVDPRGNYAADTLIHLLRCKSAAAVERWRSSQPVSSCAILVGLGDHWQAVLMDKDKQWFVLERITKYPVQNLTRFLSARLTNGAVYEVGMFETLPNPSYLNAIARPQQNDIVSTRSARNSLAKSPPRKRRYTDHHRSCFVAFASSLSGDSAPFAVNFQKVTTQIAKEGGPEVRSTLTGVILPTEFQEDPRFNFQGPSAASVFAPPTNDDHMTEGVEALMDAMTPEVSPRGNAGDDIGQNEEHPRRSTRTRTQPLLYQSDEVEREEKNARH